MKTIAACGASFILGVIFLLAAFSKVGDLSGFLKSVEGISFLPGLGRGLIILFIPSLELTLGLCFLSRIAIREAAILACGLLVSFLCFGIYLNLMNRASGCHCFKMPTPTWLTFSGWWIVARNCLFLGMSGFVLWHSDPQGGILTESPQDS